MARQLNIRSDRAYNLATDLATRQGKSIARVVEEALDAYRVRELDERARRWRKALEHDWAKRNDSDFKIDDLYDPDTGLPA